MNAISSLSRVAKPSVLSVEGGRARRVGTRGGYGLGLRGLVLSVQIAERGVATAGGVGQGLGLMGLLLRRADLNQAGS